MTMVVNESGGDVAIVASEESNKSSVSWGAVIAGAVAAAAVSLLLMLLGSGLGLAVISPWSIGGASLTTIAASALIWVIFVHWIGSAVGGYLAGRLRTGWTGVERDEVMFRDTAHGFLTWAIAVLMVATLSGLAASSVLFAGVQAASTVAGGVAQNTAPASSQGTTSGGGATGSVADPMAYYVDLLFRPAVPAGAVTATPAPAGTAGAAVPVPAEVRGEAERILVQDLAATDFPANDRAYLTDLVASRTGLGQDAARMRVDSVIMALQDAKAKAKDAADKARKVAATAALGLVLALLVGAFVASVAAAYGGHLRDEPSP